MAFSLKNKTAIVTGAGTGIGRAIAERLAEAGAQVVVAGNIRRDYQQVAKEINSRGGVAVAQTIDVSRRSQVDWLIAATVKQFKGIDILVNNAGIVKMSPLHRLTERDWQKIQGVNLDGVFFGMRAVLPVMMKKKRGKIINITSIAGLIGFDQSAVYCASKGGVIALTRAAAVEYAGLGININCIAPGVIKTPMTDPFLSDAASRASFQAQTPYKRLGEPDDIAYSALYLASDESDFINGEVLVVDGGWTAR